MLFFRVALLAVTDFGVIDETDDWLVVDKPAPLIVHPANRQAEPTLLGGVEALLACEIASGHQPAIVNRLDRDTSGIVLVAKHRAAAGELGKLFEKREVSKRYLAIVHGWPERDEWTCREPILRAGELGPSDIWVRQTTHPSGRVCVTGFRVMDRRESGHGMFSLVECVPETGRMHQIRVHLAACGHPIIGDKIYQQNGRAYLEWMRDGWTPELAATVLLPRHALHASELSLVWNGSMKIWRSPLPGDLTAFLANQPCACHPMATEWRRQKEHPFEP